MKARLLFSLLIFATTAAPLAAQPDDAPRRDRSRAETPEPPQAPEPPQDDGEDVAREYQLARIEALEEAREGINDAIEDIEDELEDADSEVERSALNTALEALKSSRDNLDAQIEAARKSGDKVIKGKKGKYYIMDEESEEVKEVILGKENTIRIIEDEDGDVSIKLGSSKKGEDGGESCKEDKAPKDVEMRFLDFGLGLNFFLSGGDPNLAGDLDDFELKQPNSVNFLLSFLPTRVNLIDQRLHLRTALELDFHNYKFSDGVTLQPEAQNFAYTVTRPNIFDRNKLSMTYLNVPLMLHFTTDNKKPRKSFRISAGGYAGLRISSHTKQRSDEFGKVKEKDDFHLNNWQYGVAAHIGYKGLEFYTRYALSDAFQEGVGAPDLETWTFGILLARL